MAEAMSEEEPSLSSSPLKVENCNKMENNPNDSSNMSSCSEEEEEEEKIIKDIFPNLSHWIACFCVVTFDLELGQAIEVSE